MAKHVGKEERRRQLVQAGLECFAKKGYHGAQVADIIAQAGVARGTFYLYFEGKRQIFEEIVGIISAKILGGVKKIETGDITTIPDQVVANIQRPTRALLEDSSAVKILFSEAVGLDEEADGLLREFYGGILVQIRAALSNGQLLGVIRDGDPQTMSVMLLGAIKEIFYQHALDKKDLDPDSLVKEIFTFVLHAVIKPGLVPTMLLKLP